MHGRAPGKRGRGRPMDIMDIMATEHQRLHRIISNRGS